MDLYLYESNVQNMYSRGRWEEWEEWEEWEKWEDDKVELSGLTAWGKKLLCSPVSQEQILL